jgi:hypothetical protein
MIARATCRMKRSLHMAVRHGQLPVDLQARGHANRALWSMLFKQQCSCKLRIAAGQGIGF